MKDKRARTAIDFTSPPGCNIGLVDAFDSDMDCELGILGHHETRAEADDRRRAASGSGTAGVRARTAW